MAFQTRRFEIDYGGGRIDTTVVSAARPKVYARRLSNRADRRFRGASEAGLCGHAIEDAEATREKTTTIRQGWL